MAMKQKQADLLPFVLKKHYFANSDLSFAGISVKFEVENLFERSRLFERIFLEIPLYNLERERSQPH